MAPAPILAKSTKAFANKSRCSFFIPHAQWFPFHRVGLSTSIQA
jgi:hypothetical protein